MDNRFLYRSSLKSKIEISNDGNHLRVNFVKAGFPKNIEITSF